MPDIFDQIAKPTPATGQNQGQAQAQPHPQGGDIFDQVAAPQPQQPTFGSRLYDSTIGAVKAIGDAYTRSEAPTPLSKVTDVMVVQPVAALAKRTMESKAPGPLKVLDAIGSVVVPDSVMEDAKQGNFGAAAGGMLGNAAMLAGPKLLGKAAAAAPVARVGEMIAGGVKAAGVAEESALPATARAVERPLAPSPMQRAVEYADKNQIATTVGERLNSPGLMATERMATVVPGASGTANEFYATRNAQVARKGADFVDRLGGAAEDSSAAAEEAVKRLTSGGQRVPGTVNQTAEGRGAAIKSFADKKYDAVREAIERNREKLQTAADAQYEQDVRSAQVRNAEALRQGILQNRKNAFGYGQNKIQPISEMTTEPLPERPKIIPGGMDMRPVQERLRPLYEELDKTLPTTQKEASPGFARLKAIVTGDEPVRSVLDVDRDLSEIKRVLRSESSGYANTQSGRMAANTIAELEKDVQRTVVEHGGPKALQNLMEGRAAVKEMHRTYELLDRVLPPGESPVNLFNRITMQGDRRLNDLLALKQRAPKAVQEIGATYLENALSKVTGEGGMADLDAAANSWKKLGPRTKVALYGPETAADLNDFFANAPKLVKKFNKSETAYGNVASKTLGAGGAVVAALAGFNPAAAAEGVAAAGATIGGANLMARFLFKGGNAKLVQRFMEAEPGSAMQRALVKRLNAAVAKEPGLQEALQGTAIAGEAQRTNQ